MQPKSIHIYLEQSLLITEELEYLIVAQDCIWMLEDLLEPASPASPASPEHAHASTSTSTSTSHMTLYLHKATPFELFPGCEW
jgi:hypothetical protein